MAPEAIVCYQRALQSKPDYAMAFGEYYCHTLVLFFTWIKRHNFFVHQYFSGNLASIYYEQGNLEMAINHYKQAISRDPAFLEAYNNLVSLFLLYNKWNDNSSYSSLGWILLWELTSKCLFCLLMVLTLLYSLGKCTQGCWQSWRSHSLLPCKLSYYFAFDFSFMIFTGLVVTGILFYNLAMSFIATEPSSGTH